MFFYKILSRLNAVTGWCGQQEAFTYVSVDLGSIHRVKAILVKVRWVFYLYKISDLNYKLVCEITDGLLLFNEIFSKYSSV